MKICTILAKGGYSSGHSGYGHSGYGHSGYDHKASHSGYGHSSGGYGHEEPCCPLVLDPLMLLALLGAIAAATYFLRSKTISNIFFTISKNYKKDDHTKRIIFLKLFI